MEELSRPSVDERAIVTALERHGLASAAAKAIYRLGQELRTRTLQDGLEYAAMADAESGEHLGAILRGASDEVDLAEQLRTMRRNRRYAARARS